MSATQDERMRSFCDKLHADGLDEWISLPEIAVMGDTSCGKSSLLSALSGIPLPSNAEITTRCPLRLHMAKNDLASASIGIKWHPTSAYANKDHAWITLKREAFSSRDAWINRITAEIENAQKDIITVSKKEVARDIIEVNFYCPKCTDLTLIDLPGIVRVAGKNEDESIINDIKSLQEDYLRNDRCVVLAVMPANVDFHNNPIIADAKKQDPTTMRTLPVITKPDLIDKGAEASVLDLLLGKKMDDFNMGFHMVKCRGQEQLNGGMTLEEGVKEEQRFFSSTEPWKTQETHSPSLFGVLALREKLSALQLRMISEACPSILKELARLKSEAQEELTLLGEPVQSAYERRSIYMDGINKAIMKLQSQLEGRGAAAVGEKTVLAKQNEAFTAFRESVLSQKLANVSRVEMGMQVLVMTKDGSEESGKVVDISADCKVFHVLPESIEDNKATKLLGTEESQIHERTTIGNLLCCTSKSSLCIMCLTLGSNNKCAVAVGNVVNKDNKNTMVYRHFAKVSASDIRRDPQWLEVLICDNSNNDLPCFLSATLFNSIVADMVQQDWAPLCDCLIKSCRDRLYDVFTGAFASLPSRFPHIGVWVADRIDAVFKDCMVGIKGHMEKELIMDENPYTQNHYLFETIHKMRNEELKKRIVKVFENTAAVAMTCQQGVDIVKGAFQGNANKSMERHAAEEMALILDSYGKVASKRIIDQMPMLVRDMVKNLSTGLKKALLSITDEDLAVLVKDEFGFMEKYTRAKKKVDAMERAEQAVMQLR